jgi:hypothetical protein
MADGVEFGAAELDPTADADVVQDAQEPLGLVWGQSQEHVGLSLGEEALLMMEKLVEAAAGVQTLLGHGVFEEALFGGLGVFGIVAQVVVRVLEDGKKAEDAQKEGFFAAGHFEDQQRVGAGLGAREKSHSSRSKVACKP